MSDADTRQHITPEMVIAFQRGDRRELYRLLQLKPWETNPLDAIGECPYPPTSAGALTWPMAVALREELKGTLGDEVVRTEQNHKCRRQKKR